MPINKVDFAGQTLIDLTGDTVTTEKLLKGITAHDKTGNLITGTAEVGGGGGKNAVTGTITFPSNRPIPYKTDPLVITHNLGQIPTFFAITVCAEKGSKPKRAIESIVAIENTNGEYTDSYINTSFTFQYPEQSRYGRPGSLAGRTYLTSEEQVDVYAATTSTITIGASFRNYEFAFRGGVEYRWIAAVG